MPVKRKQCGQSVEGNSIEKDRHVKQLLRARSAGLEVELVKSPQVLWTFSSFFLPLSLNCGAEECVIVEGRFRYTTQC